jgi:ubiquinone biosynthesis UbiH/UbiF/VisC/COQ6 family hydroxylase
MIFDVLIVGGGLVGASLAHALDRAGLSCALVEGAVPREPHPDAWDSRVYALSPSSCDFLRDLGVWQEIDARRAAPVREMHVYGDGGSKLCFGAYECGTERLATIVEAGSLQHALWRSLPSHRRLRVVCPATPASLAVRADCVEMSLGAGGMLRGRLLVGADGARSWVRDAARFAVRRTASREAAAVANFTCERPHHGRAFQWFMQDGVLAWLPLPGNRMSMVWSTRQETAAALVALPPAELCARVGAAGGHRLGALELLTPAAAFPIAPLSVARRVRPRIVLVGDAAHVIHPLAGQGVNLGFGDANELAARLACAAGGDPGAWARLRGFERARAGDILAMRMATTGLQRLFAVPGPAAAAIRNLGLNLTDRLPVLKNILARRAMESG